MKKFIVGFILGSLISSSIVFAYRMPKPTKFTKIDENTIVQLNEILEQLWDITNGRYTPEVVTTIPAGTASEGDMRLYYSGSTRRIYFYLNGAWRYWNSDG